MNKAAADRALAKADEVRDAKSFAAALADYCLELVAAGRHEERERIRAALHRAFGLSMHRSIDRVIDEEAR